MSEATHLRGVLTVFQTPFDDDEFVDFESLDAELTWLFDNGVHGIVMAMVSETLRLSTDERKQVAEFVCSVVGGRGSKIISVGSESLHTSQQLASHAEQAGADAVMAIPPISQRLSNF